MNEDIVKSLTRLETKVEGIEQAIAELKNDLKQTKGSLLPVTGGIFGVLAAMSTAYLQATGHA